MIYGWDFGEEVADFGTGKHDRQLELRLGADERELLRPLPFEGFLPKEFEGADELRGGLAGNLLARFEVNTILANLFGRDQFGRTVVVFAELANTGGVGLDGARQDGQERQVIAEGF